jgi:hypothetical protein
LSRKAIAPCSGIPDAKPDGTSQQIKHAPHLARRAPAHFLHPFRAVTRPLFRKFSPHFTTDSTHWISGSSFSISPFTTFQNFLKNLQPAAPQ